jgi:hypothetical protein
VLVLLLWEELGTTATANTGPLIPDAAAAATTLVRVWCDCPLL